MKKSNTKSRIIMMARQGVKASEIADKVGVSVSYVYTVRKEMKDNDPEVKSKTKDKPLSLYERHLKDSLAQARADMVNHPPHYTAGGIETIDFIEAKKLGYNLGNVVKYTTRSDLKGDRLENLKKAQWYLNREIKNEEKVK
jgi:transposase